MLNDNSRTFKNIRQAFIKECVSCVKNILYTRCAREDGFEQIADIFRKTAANDLTHAKLLLSQGGKETGYTSDNLMRAKKDKEERRAKYTEYSARAMKEGYISLSKLFERLARIETAHRERFFILRENMDTAKIFCKDTRQTWVCRSCGYETKGMCSSRICPVCGRRQGFTQIKNENY